MTTNNNQLLPMTTNNHQGDLKLLIPFFTKFCRKNSYYFYGFIVKDKSFGSFGFVLENLLNS